MDYQEKVAFTAQKARETFLAIRNLRKTMPQDRKFQRDALKAEIKKLRDKWWEDVGPLMKRGKYAWGDDEPRGCWEKD